MRMLVRLASVVLLLVSTAFVFRRELAGIRPVRNAISVPLRFAIWATGCATGCTFAAATGEIGATLTDGAERIKARSSLLRRDGGLELWRTPYGEFWTSPYNALFFDLAEQAVDIYADQSQSIAVNSGDVVLDCGANVGTFTRTALTAGAAKVIAFEIDPRNLAAFRRTFTAEIADGRVVLVEKGVWDRRDTLEAKFYSNTNLNSIVLANRVETSEKPQIVLVPLVRIDDALDELGITHIDFVKMDVEGAEPKALEGARATILRDRPRLAIATENDPDDITRVPAWVNSLKLSYREITGPCRKIRPWAIRPEVVFFVAP